MKAGISHRGECPFFVCLYMKLPAAESRQQSFISQKAQFKKGTLLPMQAKVYTCLVNFRNITKEEV